MKLMLGIDTGGTYTDAVVMDEAGTTIIAAGKVPTVHDDLASGIGRVIESVVSSPAVEATAIGLVSVSTTLATNALVEGQGDPACLVLAGFGPGEVDRIRAVLAETDSVEDAIMVVPGGHDALGNELQPLDVSRIEGVAAETRDRVLAYAVAAQFSVRNPAHELAIATTLGEASGHPVTCSHELSSKLNAPRRALTALLNARLIGMIGRLAEAVGLALDNAGIRAPLMMVRGDGSLVSSDFVSRRPIETILSGPAASVVGARFLTGTDEADGLVVDIGGTTTDIAALRNGRPVITADGAEVAGHRTMVEAVDLSTHGLGGDSEVWLGADGLRLGPARVLPLSRLAVDHPEIIGLLSGQRAGSGPTQGHGRLLVGARSDRVVAMGGGDERERRVLEALGEGPMLETVVAPSSLARAAVSRLRGRGLVRVATVTPTDAALLLASSPGAVGPDASDQSVEAAGMEAARLGFELLARQSDRRGRPTAASAEELAALIEERLVETSAALVLDAALRADGFEAARRAEGFGADARALLDAGLTNHMGLVSLSVALGRPLTAVGASAGYYYPRVAARLGAEVVVPDHAEVANAVGAVVGRIRIERCLTITRPRAGSFEVHGLGTGPSHRSVEDARRYAEQALREEVLHLAAEAGAAEVGPEVEFDWQARTALVEGREMLVEATLCAVATGRPRLT